MTLPKFNKLSDKSKALIICLIGILLAVIILGSLMGAYTSVERDDKKTNKVIDISGIIVIIVSSILYWLFFTRIVCISYNLASMWPRLAFRYGLGGGIFFLMFQNLVSNENTLFNSFEDYFPLLVLSFIFGHYIFLFMEIASMENHNCLIKIQNL